MRFENRTAIITGAASGMGLCASQEMAKEGAIVYMVDVNAARVTELAQEIVSAADAPCPAREMCAISIRFRPSSTNA